MPVNKKREDSRFYKIWGDMKQRCLNKNNISYHHYGGRGITVCEDWIPYQGFYEDMWKSYCEHVEKYGVEQTTIDRIDVNKGYNKDNCRWATRSEQNVNTRNKKTYIATNLTTGEEIEFVNCVQFCKDNYFNRSAVLECLAGRFKKHRGFSFRYKKGNVLK